MSSILERLFAPVALLFAAAATKRKKARRKPGQRPSKKHKKRSASRAARRVSRKSRKKRRAPSAKKAAAHKESLGGEPLPKPAPPIGRAILISPEDGKYVDSVNPTFRWLSVGGATRYEVLWGEDPGLSNGHSTISLATEAAVPVEKPLRVGATYYWRVRGGNDGGWGPWSPTASFRVLEETN